MQYAQPYCKVVHKYVRYRIIKNLCFAKTNLKLMHYSKVSERKLVRTDSLKSIIFILVYPTHIKIRNEILILYVI